LTYSQNTIHYGEFRHPSLAIAMKHLLLDARDTSLYKDCLSFQMEIPLETLAFAATAVSQVLSLLFVAEEL
jgi:hypothetical protein